MIIETVLPWKEAASCATAAEHPARPASREMPNLVIAKIPRPWSASIQSYANLAEEREVLRQDTRGGWRMELGLEGKVALVTGSSRGIGQGIALAFAGEGCDVLLTARDERALDDVAAAIRAKGRKAVGVALDLRAEGAAAKLMETARREFGGLDILVNNAGATKRGDF